MAEVGACVVVTISHEVSVWTVRAESALGGECSIMTEGLDAAIAAAPEAIRQAIVNNASMDKGSHLTMKSAPSGKWEREVFRSPVKGRPKKRN